MAKTLSGEEHKALVEQSKPRRNPTELFKPIALVAAVLILAGLSFVGGIQYQKNHAKKAAGTTATTQVGNNGQLGPNAQNGFGGGRRRFGGQRPVMGQVTAVDASSITINDQNSTSTTFSIASTTTVTDNGQSSTVGAIKVGDNVAIIASTTDTKQAARILLNPNFNGSSPTGSTNSPDPSSIN